VEEVDTVRPGESSVSVDIHCATQMTLPMNKGPYIHVHGHIHNRDSSTATTIHE